MALLQHPLFYANMAANMKPKLFLDLSKHSPKSLMHDAYTCSSLSRHMAFLKLSQGRS